MEQFKEVYVIASLIIGALLHCLHVFLIWRDGRNRIRKRKHHINPGADFDFYDEIPHQ